ncbi:hypothetical protein B0H14DRAFT_1408108 [Mycena olivaceomarginata]|nr:hypothetical protein B0H14DRAFT_1408108 [Mycena olivaceomarginata]
MLSCFFLPFFLSLSSLSHMPFLPVSLLPPSHPPSSYSIPPPSLPAMYANASPTVRAPTDPQPLPRLPPMLAQYAREAQQNAEGGLSAPPAARSFSDPLPGPSSYPLPSSFPINQERPPLGTHRGSVDSLTSVTSLPLLGMVRWGTGCVFSLSFYFFLALVWCGGGGRPMMGCGEELEEGVLVGLGTSAGETEIRPWAVGEVLRTGSGRGAAGRGCIPPN